MEDRSDRRRLAHDFNNVLTGIMGFTELSLGHLAPGTLPASIATEVHHSARNGTILSPT